MHGISGCESSGHSSYFDYSELKPSKKGRNDSNSPDDKEQINEKGENGTKTYDSSRMKNASSMLISLILHNRTKKLKPNVMLEPRSTGSFIRRNDLPLNGMI